MQTCELCGWDTRSDTRICSSCQRAGADGSEVPRSDTELLAAVLHAAGDDRQTDGHESPPGRVRSDPELPRDGTQVVLREVDPDEHDAPATAPTERPGTPSIAASLIEALSSPIDAADDLDAREPASAAEDGDSTADVPERAADVDDDDPGQTDDLTTPEARAADHDTDEIVADDDPDAAADVAADDEAQHDDAHDQHTADAHAAADDEAQHDDTPDQRAAEPDTAATRDAADADAAADDEAGADDPPDERAAESDAAATRDAADDDAAAVGSDGDGESKTVGQRLGARFDDVGGWAAVAQVGLLLVALLCVFQVVVLLVVHQFLAQAPTQGAAADLLVAHARAINVMVPVLVGCALIAVVFAAWHARPAAADGSEPVRRWFGLPVRLWTVAAVAGAVLGVVLLDASTTVEQARQTTLWAIATCALLGVTALVSPRAIAVPYRDGDEQTSSAGDRHAERDGSDRRAA